MYCYTGGGGGHGDPLERNPSVVAEDVLDRKVSAQSARNDYGVVINEKTRDFDPEETERQRKQMRTRRGPITWTYDLGGDLGVL